MFMADAQVHIWAPETAQRKWRPGQAVHREIALGAEELLGEMDAAGVARCVLIPPYWEGDRHDVVLAAAREHPERFTVMARPDTEAQAQPGAIAGWMKQAEVRGIRCSFNRPRQIAMLSEGKAEWLWDEIEEAGAPVMVLLPQSLMPLLEPVLARHPRLRIALSHLGLNSHEYDEHAFRDLDRLLALAAWPNASVKFSALPAYTRDRYPYRRLHPHLRRVYDAFGPRRIFWGTDYARLPCTYSQAVTMYTEEMPWLTSEDKAWIMGRGLCEWLGWELPSA